jgi:hypothetical protein
MPCRVPGESTAAAGRSVAGVRPHAGSGASGPLSSPTRPKRRDAAHGRFSTRAVAGMRARQAGTPQTTAAGRNLISCTVSDSATGLRRGHGPSRRYSPSTICPVCSYKSAPGHAGEGGRDMPRWSAAARARAASRRGPGRAVPPAAARPGRAPSPAAARRCLHLHALSRP